MTRHARAAAQAGFLAGFVLAGAVFAEAPAAPASRTFYVRQTVGEDTSDGLTPATAWRTLSRLSERVQAGDVAYVGPGLYRESVNVTHGGNPGARIVFVADPSGAHTGDPPGTVLVAGSDPVDETLFQPTETRGVYQLHVPDFHVLGAVEMDGAQHRYGGVLEPVVGPPPLERVKATRASFFYDGEAKVLFLHTSDDQEPASHELELIRRHSGFFVVRRPWVGVVGFTFRHFGDAPINFRFAPHGVAIGNVAWGSRQGIRVRESDDVVLQENTLFRNENSGAYFVAGSAGGVAIGNIAYENVKGLRWSSESLGGLALDNVLFGNREAGLSLEHAAGALARGNRLVANARTQLLLHETQPVSDGNCFETGKGSASLAERYAKQSYGSLAEHQQATHLDLSSQEGSCGALPHKVDVEELHANSLVYLEQARRKLGK